MQFYIGTAGWVYPHWRTHFYPQDLAGSDWLTFYAGYLLSVEINRSFYRLPTVENVAAWRDATPDDFQFAVKASRYITHMKKLKEPEKTLPPLLDCVEGLGNKLGPVLFQLPPRWRANPDRLREFLQAKPAGLSAVFELRDPSWHNDEILAILAESNAAFCIYDIGGFTTPCVSTADFLYLRLHGPDEAYCGCYSKAELAEWAQWLTQQPVTAAYVYFDNDQAGYAVQNAMELRALLQAG